MKKVVAIKFLKNKRIKITLDNSEKISISEDSYIQIPLQIGDTLDSQQWEQLQQVINFDQCYQKAFNYLNYTAHSSGLIYRKLYQKKYAKEIINKVIQELVKLGYINDENFCQLFIEQKKNNYDWGEYRIRQKLNEYGIAKELIEKKMLSDYSPGKELEKAKKAFDKKWKSFTLKEPLIKKKDKMIQFLQRKGFKMDIIWQVIKENIVKEDDRDFNNN